MKKIGRSQKKRNGYHIMNTRKPKRRSICNNGRGFYQKEQSAPEKKNNFEAMLSRFATTSEKRHDVTDVVL